MADTAGWTQADRRSVPCDAASILATKLFPKGMVFATITQGRIMYFCPLLLALWKTLVSEHICQHLTTQLNFDMLPVKDYSSANTCTKD